MSKKDMWLSLGPTGEKRLIVAQLNRLIEQHEKELDAKAELRRLLAEIQKESEQAPFVRFPKMVFDSALDDRIKHNLIRFVQMEQQSLYLDPISSENLDSNIVLTLIQEGRMHAERADGLNGILFVGNTGAGKSTMINGLNGCKLVWGRYFKDSADPDGEGWVEYEQETLLDLPEIRQLDVTVLQKIKGRIAGWCPDMDSIDSFMDFLRKQGIGVTEKIKTLTEKTIELSAASGGLKSPSNFRRRVLMVDERGSSPKAITPIGHAIKSKTLYPVVIKGAHLDFIDCPGFADTRTKEIEIANAVNIMNTVEKLNGVKIVIMINYFSLKADRSKGLSDLWGIIQNLFGDQDTVIKYKDSILINVSHVPEEADGGQNSLDAIKLILEEKVELIPLLDQVTICDPLDRTLADGVITLNEFSFRMRSLRFIRNPGSVFCTAMSEGTQNALMLFANDAKDAITRDLIGRQFKDAYGKLNYLTHLSVLKNNKLNEKIQEVREHVHAQLQLITDRFYKENDLEELELLHRDLSEGILLDRLLSSQLVTESFFKVTFQLLKLQFKRVVPETNLISEYLQHLYNLVVQGSIQNSRALIRQFIDDMYEKGCQVAVTPYTERLVAKLARKLNLFVAANPDIGYREVRVSDFDNYGRYMPRENPGAQKVFEELKTHGWLRGKRGSDRAEISLPARDLFLRKPDFPSLISTDEGKKALIKLFQERLVIGEFLASKYLKFHPDSETSHQEVENNIYKVAKESATNWHYGIYQIRQLLTNFFFHAKVEKYQFMLRSLEFLDYEFANNKGLQLTKEIRSFESINQRLKNTSSQVPVGSIFMLPCKGVPLGFMLCDGAWLSASKFAALYHVLRGTFGERLSDNNETIFKLPDYRNCFLRGLTDGRELSEKQECLTKLPKKPFVTEATGAHTHDGTTSESGEHIHHFRHWDGPKQRFKNSDYDPASIDDCQWKDHQTDAAGSHTHTFTTALSGLHTHVVSGGGDSETRPVNYAVNYIIKC
jgi:microcystin-dependent protein